METILIELGCDVGVYIGRARTALASYSFYKGNRDGMAPQQTIDKIRELLTEAAILSRGLVDPATEDKEAGR